MQKIILTFFLLAIFPLATADIITPGYSPIEINNKITNMAEYPDYTFIVTPDGKVNSFLINEELNIVEKDGTIKTPYYKFEKVSVYAIETSKFDPNYIKNLTHEEAINYFENTMIKVIENISHYKEKHISDPIKTENNFYEINLSETKGEPNKQATKKNSLIYLYILIPLICLITIIHILTKRKNNGLPN